MQGPQKKKIKPTLIRENPQSMKNFCSSRAVHVMDNLENKIG
jgi:hypothetical protein